MFIGWTQAEIEEYQGRHREVETVLAAMKQTSSLARAADHAGLSRSYVSRLMLAWRIVEESGDHRMLLRGRSTGRPTLQLTQAEADALRSAYVTSNRCRGMGSMTYAARSCARDPASPLRPVTREEILRPRSSKHLLPVNVRRAMRGAAAVVQHYRDPRGIALGGYFAPGTIRMTIGSDGAERRLFGGERWCGDDASVNFGVCVPWERGGDPCSDKFGVRLGRYQLLAVIDCASDKCVGYTYTIRERDSYRGGDIVAMLNNAMTLNRYRPAEMVLEGGAWQSDRVLEFLRLTGVSVIDAKGRPHQKLIENWLNRLWTPLSDRVGGQIGRNRGEMRRETVLWTACREGREDPRQHFPMLTTALSAIDGAIDYIDNEVTESREYGNWVPLQFYRESLAAHPRPAYRNEAGYLAARVREERKVRRFGMVSCTAESPLGNREVYHFGGADLSAFNGASVWIHFDPFATPVEATITLSEDFQEARSGTVVATGLAPMNAAPEIIRSREGLFSIRRHNGIREVQRAKRSLSGMVRRETRVLGLDAARVRGITEISAPALEPEISDFKSETTPPAESTPDWNHPLIKTREQMLEAAAG